MNYTNGGTAQAPATITSNGSGVVTLTGLSAGSYGAFTVSRLGCTSASFAGPVVLNNPAPPAAPVATSNSPVCINGTLNLSANTIANATYSWTGPNGFSATTQNPSVTNIQTNGAGTYSVTATVASCTSTAGTTTVVVNVPPATPGAITGSTTPCANTSQTYSVTPVAGATTYTWTLPNGFTGTSATASITVTTSTNSGTVTVKANNPCGTSATQTLSVTPIAIPAAPGAITGNTTPCANTSQTYSVAAVAGATAYIWTLPNGWTGTSATNTINVTTGTTNGVITVKAGNGCGASVAQSLNVILVNPPATPGAITGSTTPCANTSQTYSVTPVAGATTYTWTLPNGFTGTSATNSITTTTSSNSGIINVTASNACGASSSSATLSINITPVPAPPGSIAGNASPCIGTSQVYSITATPNVTSYTWTAPNGWSGTSTSNVIMYTPSANNGNITVQATNVCGTGPASTLAVTPNPVVTPSVTISTPTIDICQGASATFTATPVNGGATPTYQWKKNGLNVGNSSATYTDALLVSGDAISVTLTSNAPCATTASVTATNNIVVNIKPTEVPGININIFSAVVLCEGTGTTFVTNIVGGGPNPTYQWYKNGAPLPGVTTPNYISGAFNSGDTVSVVLKTSAQCPAFDTVRSNKVGIIVVPNTTTAVTVSASPDTTVAQNTQVTFTATLTAPGNAPYFQWYRNQQPIALENGTTYTTRNINNGDLFSVRVTNLGQCAIPALLTSKGVKMRIIPLDINPVVPNSSMVLYLYPNPNGGQFTVGADWPSGAAGEQVQLELVNGLGQVVYSKTEVPASNKWRTNVQLEENIANGVYLLRISRQSDGSNITRRVMIQR